MQTGAHTLRSLTLFVSSHFMFNVLSKLQSEILAGEKRHAVSTLSQYSKLIRLACKMAEKNTIDLKEEGDFLERYLKLEQERFSESPFQFSISGFDSDVICIEPFLLQPYIELAILGSLGLNEPTIHIVFDISLPTITISSQMKNIEVIEKLEEKCKVAQERLMNYNHTYTLSHLDGLYIQSISLNPKIISAQKSS